VSEPNKNARPRVTVQHFATNDEQTIKRLRAELAAAQALNKAWEQKAATWLATPEAAARLQSYRDLGQQAAQAQNESDALRAELAAAQKQRDEARELYCVEAAHRSVCLRSVIDARTIARVRGWDCFKEWGGA
jgi:predicted  nucleic acid-binding Zn-ribbon protein